MCLIACHRDRFLIFSKRLAVVEGDVTRLKVSMQHCESVKIDTEHFLGHITRADKIAAVSALVEEGQSIILA